MGDDTLFLVLGNGWVARECYEAAITRLGRGTARVIDTTPEIGGAEALNRAQAFAASRRDLVVIVATPNASHWALARTFLATGNRVLVEKPLALPDEVSEQDIDADAIGRLFVSAPFRHRPDVARLRALIATGIIGDVREVVISWRRRAGIPRPGSWYTNKPLAGGGVLVDLGPHLLDVALDLLGWPDVLVTACALTSGGDWTAGASSWMTGPAAAVLPCDVEIGARVSLADRIGRTVTIEAAWASDVAEDTTTIDVVGTTNRVRLVTLFGFAPGRSIGCLSGAARGDIVLERDPALDFARMLEALQRGTGATGRQGLAVMEVIAQAYRVAAPTHF